MRRLLWLPVFLLFSTSLAAGLLLGTESGLQWSIRQLESFSDGRLTITSARGRWLDEIRLYNIRYRDSHTTLTLKQLRLRWQPASLLQGILQLDSLEAEILQILRREKKMNEPQRSFQGFSSPLPIRLETATVRDLRFQQEGSKPVILQEIGFQGELHNTTLTIQQLVITAPQGAAEATGRLETSAALRFSLSSRWHWNAPPSSPFTASGELRIEGIPEKYQFEIHSRLPSDRFSPAVLELNGTGNLSELHIGKLQAHWLDGLWQGTGRLTWRPSFTWQAALSAEGIDPVRGWEKWPGGRIDLQLDGKGRADHIEMELKQLSGKIRGYPVAASGRFLFTENLLQLEQVRLTSGSARFTASGTLGKRWNANWELTAPELAHLWPDLAGSVKASGHITGPRRLPAFQVVLDGEAIRWKNHLARRIRIDTELGLEEKKPWRLEAGIEGLTLGKEQLRRVSLIGDGFTHGHRLHLHIERDNTTWLHSEILGKLEGGIWRGTLKKGELALPKQRWRQREATRLEIGRNTTFLSPWCWQHKDAHLCLEGKRTGEGWQGDLSLKKLRLAWLRPWLPREDLSFTGVAEGEARLLYRKGGIEGSRLTLRIHDGSVSYRIPDEERYDVAYREIALVVEKQPEALTATLNVDLRKTGRAHGAWQLPGWTLAEALSQEQAVNGALTLHFNDLTLLALLTPRIQHPTGNLSGEITFGGRLGAPRLDGLIRLDDGSLMLPDLGITLREVRLLARTLHGSRLSVTGGARSGSGSLALAGELDFVSPSHWKGWITIKGEEVEVARIPEAKVIASPNLKVQLQPGVIQLSGYLEIPRAKLQLPEKQGLVPVSPDVVIIGEEGKTPQKRWRIATTLALKLGKKVKVSGHGFEGRISGQLAIIEAPNRPAIAQGELEIHDGSYKVYGQKLNIDEGRLLYAASPLTNPGLQFRVVRRQRGVEAGILVFGRLKQPELQLFSTPPMDDSDILAYLLIGKPLREATTSEGDRVSQAARSLQLAGGTWLAKRLGKELDIEEVSIESGSGEDAASLVLGKYLSPRLYVQYVIGLTEGGNILRARYELNKNWILESESGQHSGIDLLFTLER